VRGTSQLAGRPDRDAGRRRRWAVAAQRDR
jgi:hypothetical protein